MTSYKVTYFSIRGLGEPIRFLLSYGGVDFIDDRIEFQDWPKLKKDTPFGQLPLLEVNGKKIFQSTAICRYLAKQFGLAGKDDWENLEIDSTVDTFNDLRIKIFAHLREENAEAKAKKIEDAKELVPFYIQRLDEQVKKNGGYFVGGKLTWADIVFVATLDTCNFVSKYDIIEKADNLKALRNKVLAEPKIKAWVDKRPVTDM